MPPISPVVASTIAQVGTNVLNANMQNRNNRFEHSQNMAYYNMQRQDALSDWRMQNEYNSPMAQMNRMKDAGINPHTMNGGNIVQTASAQQVRGTQMANAPKAYQVNSGTQGINTLLALEQIKNVQAQTAKTNQEAKNAAIDAQQKQLVYDTDSETMRSTKIGALWTAEANRDYMLANTEEKKAIIERTKLQMQKDLQDIQLAKTENQYRGELLRGKANLQNSQVKQTAEQINKIRAEVNRLNTENYQSIQQFPAKVRLLAEQIQSLKLGNEGKTYENIYAPEHLRERNTLDTIRARKEAYELQSREVLSPELRELLNKAPYLINMVSKLRR